MSQSILMHKRPMVDEAEASPVSEVKRARIVHETLGATELVSAFALASLASMGSRDQKDEREEQSESREEAHQDGSQSSAPIEDVRSNKKVTFSTDTKNISRETPRRLSLPSRVKHSSGPRLPPSFVRGHSYPPQHPHHGHAGQGMPVHHRHHPSWVRPRLMDHHSSSAVPPSPPPRPSPPQKPLTDKWICDFCNVAAFDSYQEACKHEECCHARFPPPPPPQRGPPPVGWHPAMPHSPSRVMYHHHPHHHPGSPPLVMSPHHRPMFPPSAMSRTISVESRSWYSGRTSLALRDSDSDWLSALNCFVRDTCVEAFSATHEDVNSPSKRGRIAPHQVGIRCCFCKHRARDDLASAAISYPVSVAGIYESVKRWQKVHVEVCPDMPVEVKTKLEELGSVNAWIPTTRQYWADSARSLGMVDTQEGIRFAQDPSQVTTRAVTVSGTQMAREAPPEGRNDEESAPANMERLSDGDNIVFPEDMALVPPYVYFLIRQVEATHFTESDRFVARSKGPIGYPGFQCRHCRGHAGLGKYFPVSSKSLSTNSTSQNIHSHLLKCRKVSPYVKDQLMALKEEKSKAPRLEPGWRRVFFDKIWSRLHGE